MVKGRYVEGMQQVVEGGEVCSMQELGYVQYSPPRFSNQRFSTAIPPIEFQNIEETCKIVVLWPL